MIDSDRITSWLQHLCILIPPDGAILVGAGTGTGQWVHLLQEWNVPSATLIEADDAQFRHLERNVAQRDGWRLRNDVVAAHAEAVTYHQANNSNENGLLEPEKLRGLWPNIKTSQQQTRGAITLESLLQDAPANWLMVDCLPALPIIQGVGLLDTLDVIAARILLDDANLSGCAASLGELQNYLGSQGYRLVVTQAGRHPTVGHAIFVRDTQAVIRNLRQQQGQAEKNRERDAELHAQQLVQAALSKQAEEYAGQLQQLTQAKAAVEELAAEYKQQIEAAKISNDKIIAAERAAAEKLAAENKQQIEAAAKAHNDAAKIANDKIAAAEKIAVERQVKIDTLEKQIKQLQEADSNLKQRQKILCDELTSAEAQIELIKDLVLRKDSL